MKDDIAYFNVFASFYFAFYGIILLFWFIILFIKNLFRKDC